MAAVAQPSGAVTLVFTDIEGSTRLLDELGVDSYREALGEHRRVVREACARHAGYEVDCEGDAFFYAFATAEAAVAAVREAMSGLEGGPIVIRVGIHTGRPELDPPKYVGLDVHRAARIMSSAHGGQVVVSPRTAALLDSGLVPLVGLGSFRLKDFDEPIGLFQLGEGVFPPLRTIANTNLPAPASSFHGREQELREANRLLQETRLLTITGPGGAGKTRFAIELAHRVLEERFGDYPDGIFSCFCSALHDLELVLPTIAHALSVREQGATSTREAIAARLAGKRLLLVLDNLEHLLPVAPDLSELLGACPGLTLVCTSRELLRVQGETGYLLPPLGDTDAVALFCERAHSEPTPAIGELCARLEGLPLALELAAARSRLLTPEQLLARLGQRLDLLRGGRDADPRQQTLRATIHWSYDLLTAAEQHLFARLAVFAGGCTLEAAEQVAGADLDTLQSLLDKSLLRRDTDLSEPRYWMLETVREYATEQLEAGASDRAEHLRQRHADYYLQFAELADTGLKGPERVAWTNRLRAEEANLRQALETFARGEAPDELLRLCAALADFWLGRGPFAEAWSWLSRALAMEGADPVARAGALQWAPFFPVWLGDTERSRPIAEEAIEACMALGDLRGVGRAMNALAMASADGQALLEASIPLFREADDGWGLARALLNLGWLQIEAGDCANARVQLEEARALSREQRDVDGVAGAEYHLGLIALLEGQDEEAHGWLAGCVRPYVEMEDKRAIASCLAVLAALAMRSGDAERTAALLGAVEQVRAQDGFVLEGVEHEVAEEARERARSALGDTSFEQAFAAGRATSLAQALETVSHAAASRA